MIVTIVFLMAPAAFHRIVEHGQDAPRVHTFASIMLLSAMVPLALGIAGDSYVVVLKVTQSQAFAVATAGLALLFFYGLWFGLTLADQSRSMIEALAMPPPSQIAVKRVAATTPLQLVHRRQHQPRAAGAERMAERDRATVDVQSIQVDAQLFLPRQRHRGERLVDFEQRRCRRSTGPRAAALCASPGSGRSAS